MRTILILMDSLNRHYISPYGESWIRTPNLNRLAARSLVFDNHWCGSMPCMPARRELMTGRTNFLETPWGPIEAWDESMPTIARETAGVHSHMITDHYHYFHSGGDGYYDLFDSWEFERGQEADKWRPVVATPDPPEGARGKAAGSTSYWRNRAMMDPEADLSYSTPRSFERAVEFLDLNHDADNWHLHLEVFDPHEPFDSPQRYRDAYGDTWDRAPYNWPAYDRIDPDLDDEAAVRHIRLRYAATLTMADEWLGKLLDAMDRHDLWKDTTVILTTDHGHLLGEHGFWAKNYMYDYAELARIPLLVCAPGVAPGRREALTTTVDLAPTVLDLHGCPAPGHAHGRSIVPLLKEDGKHHEWILYGYFGKDVTITNGRLVYTRQPLPGSTIDLHTGDLRSVVRGDREAMARAEAGHFLPSAGDIPQFRIERSSHRHRDAPAVNLIYDLQEDPRQENPVNDPDREAGLAATLVEVLRAHDAPACQFERLGLGAPGPTGGSGRT